MAVSDPAGTTIRLTGNQLRARSFLLGNGAGMVLLGPAALNAGDRAVVPHKWFGVSAFGRKYLEVNRVTVRFASDPEAQPLVLSRHNQVSFEQNLTEAIRTFRVNGVTVRERFSVPIGGPAGLFFTLESDRPATFMVEPQFDMRYYQAFNEDLSHYGVEVGELNGKPLMSVWNEVQRPDGPLRFHSYIQAVDVEADIKPRPEDQRFFPRTYLKDEHREKLIHKAYSEIHDQSPDEAPIWDSYRTTIYQPGSITVEAPATLAFSFGSDEDGAMSSMKQLLARPLARVSEDAEKKVAAFLDRALFQTGNSRVDLAYNQVLTRFNTTLVVRDAELATDGAERTSAVFAGDKYFLDPWKRDENISLEVLLSCNDFETVRAILDSTWQHQDETSGRLPQIIQLGQPLVYFSSDGTLWALRRLFEYTKLSGDSSLLEAKRPLVETFFRISLESCRDGLLPSGSVIRRSFLWETWMDTPFTPREGYPAEIELLWLTALKDFEPWVRNWDAGLAERMAACREAATKAFERMYVTEDAGGESGGRTYVADGLDYGLNPRELLTPNPYVAFAVDFPLAKAMIQPMLMIGRHELAGRTGLVSLAQADWPDEFPSDFLNDPSNVRSHEMASVGIYNYHRGIEWLLFNQMMVALELKHGDADHAFRTYVEPLVRSALEKSGVGGLDELEDLHGPLGADFQAWSMAGFVVALRRFAGVSVNALENDIWICPQLPAVWPQLRSRHRIGSHTFVVETRRLEAGGIAVSIRHNQQLGLRLRQRVGWRIGDWGEKPRVRIRDRELPGERILRNEDDLPGIAWVDASDSSDPTPVTVELQRR